MILLIDNYDSFVFNLARYLRRLGQVTEVVRNDAVDLERIAAGDYKAIIISPGPQAPDQAGLSLQVINRFAEHIPMLGVCLGHQAICQAFGGRIVRAPQPVHGRSSLMTYQHSRLLEGLPNPFAAARYHSLIADAESLSSQLRVTATTMVQGDDNSQREIVMAVEHERLPIFGVQFHPESILSDSGYDLLARFIQLVGLSVPPSLPSSDLTDSARVSQIENGSADFYEARHEGEFPLAILPGAMSAGSDQ